MPQSITDWDQDLPKDPAEEYQALLRALRRTQGFGLLFVRCSPAEGERLIQRVREDLPEKQTGVLKFNQPISDGNFYKQVEMYLADKGSTNILFIQGLEHSLYDYEETKKRLSGWSSEDTYSYSWKGVPRLLSNLNQQRERFRDSFNVSFVFLVPLFVVKYLIHRAPDFFDWRSGTFEFPATEELFEESLRLFIEKWDIKQDLTLNTSEQREKALAIQALLEEDCQTTEQKADLLLKQGLLFVSIGQYQEAIACYDKALAIYPQSHRIWYERSNLLDDLGTYDKALASCDQALKLKSDDHLAWTLRGNILHSLQRFQDAVFSYDKSLTIKPNYYDAWDFRGDALKDLGRYEEAIDSYDRAIALEPEDSELWKNRGSVLVKLGRYKEALASYDNALESRPNDPELWNSRGNILTSLGNPKEALISYRSALEADPGNADATMRILTLSTQNSDK
ncbi:MAG: tetratricopeptide repeat protein [Pseudanabaenales cyanobacterium]|nr:tetratricopeptide repeat protein [Pseudanabaenales cyanobacterium]